MAGTFQQLLTKSKNINGGEKFKKKIVREMNELSELKTAVKELKTNYRKVYDELGKDNTDSEKYDDFESEQDNFLNDASRFKLGYKDCKSTWEDYLKKYSEESKEGIDFVKNDLLPYIERKIENLKKDNVNKFLKDPKKNDKVVDDK